MSNFTVTSMKKVAVPYYKEMLYKRSRQSRLFLKDDYKELVETSIFKSKSSRTDSDVAESALAVLCRHTWYLQEETETFSSIRSLMDEYSRLEAKLPTFEKEKPFHPDC